MTKLLKELSSPSYEQSIIKFNDIDEGTLIRNFLNQIKMTTFTQIIKFLKTRNYTIELDLIHVNLTQSIRASQY